jgi:hypothetical protein
MTWGLLLLCVCMHLGVQRDQSSLPWRMDSLGMAVRDGPMRQVCVWRAAHGYAPLSILRAHG